MNTITIHNKPARRLGSARFLRPNSMTAGLHAIMEDSDAARKDMRRMSERLYAILGELQLYKATRDISHVNEAIHAISGELQRIDEVVR